MYSFSDKTIRFKCMAFIYTFKKKHMLMHTYILTCVISLLSLQIVSKPSDVRNLQRIECK